MRFKIDENLPIEVAHIFEDAGHEAHTVHSEGLVGCTDDVLAAACRSEDRILISLDLDFADIRAYPPSAIAAYAQIDGAIAVGQ